MPLSDFVRYLNAQNVPPAPGTRSTTPFVSENGQVYVHFAKLRLESFYSPIIDVARDGDVVLTMGAGSIGAVPGKLVGRK